MRDNTGIAEIGRIAMRNWKLVVASLVFLLIAGAFGAWRLRIAPLPTIGQSANRLPVLKRDSVLLPVSETDAYIKFYLGDAKAAVQSWQPSQVDLDGLEENQPQISNLRENVPGPARRIDNPNMYFHQYLAIVQSGKKQIFVNAMCRTAGDDTDDWRHHLQIVYDGGDCFWQAFYDPATQKFSNLMINGRA
jgi:hypothetical protein